jgi:hypothetical protein
LTFNFLFSDSQMRPSGKPAQIIRPRAIYAIPRSRQPAIVEKKDEPVVQEEPGFWRYVPMPEGVNVGGEVDWKAVLGNDCDVVETSIREAGI